MLTIVSESIGDKPSIIPSLFITYGPTGSGKSTITKQVLTQYGIDESYCVKVLVDDIIDKIPSWKENVKRVVRESQSKGVDPDKELNNLYFEYRNTYGDVISDAIFYQALTTKRHIIFETTGNSIDYTIRVINLAKSVGYFTCVIYPYVEGHTLLQRLTDRENQEIQQKGYARKVDRASLASQIENAQRNFVKVSKACDASHMYNNTVSGIGKTLMMFSLVKKYQGWCKKGGRKDRCKNGIIYEASCNIKNDPGLEAMTQSKLQKYIKKHCFEQ